jgi:hypothetical protein
MGAILDGEQLCWLMQGAVTITAASADAQCRPSIGQVIGCRAVERCGG